MLRRFQSTQHFMKHLRFAVAACNLIVQGRYTQVPVHVLHACKMLQFATSLNFHTALTLLRRFNPESIRTFQKRQGCSN